MNTITFTSRRPNYTLEGQNRPHFYDPLDSLVGETIQQNFDRHRTDWINFIFAESETTVLIGKVNYIDSLTIQFNLNYTQNNITMAQAENFTYVKVVDGDFEKFYAIITTRFIGDKIMQISGRLDHHLTY